MELSEEAEKIIDDVVSNNGKNSLATTYKLLFIAGMDFERNEQDIKENEKRKTIKTLMKFAKAVMDTDVTPEQWWSQIRDSSKTEESILAMMNYCSLSNNSEWTEYFSGLYHDTI